MHYVLRPFCSSLSYATCLAITQEQNKQVTRETAAASGLVMAKSERLEQGDNILRTVLVYLQPLH